MFYINNNLTTNDKFDLAKFLEMDENGVFDSINSYILLSIPKLPLAGTLYLQASLNTKVS